MLLHVYVETYNGVECDTKVFFSLDECNRYAVWRLHKCYPEVILTGDPNVDLTALEAAWSSGPTNRLMWYTTENTPVCHTAEEAQEEAERVYAINDPA